MDFFIIVALVIALLGFGIITFVGWKVKSSDNLILSQALPFTFYFLLMGVLYGLGELWYPGISDGNGKSTVAGELTYLVGLPGMVIAVISVTALGVRGVYKSTETKEKFLNVTSLIAVSSLFTIIFTMYLYPVLFVFMLVRKVLRKKKEKENLRSA